VGIFDCEIREVAAAVKTTACCQAQAAKPSPFILFISAGRGAALARRAAHRVFAGRAAGLSQPAEKETTVKSLVVVGCYLAILATAFAVSDSSSGFLVFGLGTVLLLDQCAFRLLPWSGTSRRRLLLRRAAYLLLGAAALHGIRPGVPSGAAILLGSALSLLTFLLESASIVAVRCLRCPAWVSGCIFPVLLVALAPLIALHPLRIVPARTPTSLGLPFEDVEFTTTDGVRLRGWLVPHTEARGNAIFCHGWGRNRGHVAGLLPTLHELGLNVLAFDFRGHGESGGHTAAFGHRETADLIAADSYLRRRFPSQPLFLVGVSYGAAVTLQTLPDLADVRAVWVEGCFSRLENVVGHFLSGAPAALRPALVRYCDVVGWLDCGLWAPAVNPIKCLAEVHVPICFCHGGADDLVPFTEGKALYDAYNGPKASFWVHEASHYNIRQRHRDAYRERLRSFFGAYLAAGGRSREAQPPEGQAE
jgi:alpha-beta hydrolase superfamily lysophospholipase